MQPIVPEMHHDTASVAGLRGGLGQILVCIGPMLLGITHLRLSLALHGDLRVTVALCLSPYEHVNSVFEMCYYTCYSHKTLPEESIRGQLSCLASQL